VTHEAKRNEESPERNEENGATDPVPKGKIQGDPVGKPASARPKKKKKKDKKGGSGRGVETMFRTAYRTHLDLSSLADTKANIMISINGIIISILLATVYPSLVQYRALFLPSSLLVLTCLASLVLAVLAARPRVTRKTVTPEDVRENRANILFFGTFINMKEQDFLDGMWELIEDRERTYTTMMRDLYGLGAVLGAKYRLLRASYTVFVVGLAVGVIAFLAVYASSGGVTGGP
jgi:hypothetical protein